MRYVALGDPVAFNFSVNGASGSGRQPDLSRYTVRQRYKNAADAPILTGTPTSLTDTGFPTGCFEIAFNVTEANGFVADREYAVFVGVTVDGLTPAAYVGEFTTNPALSDPIVTPSAPGMTTVYFEVRDEDGELLPGVNVSCTAVRSNSNQTGFVQSTATVTVTSDSNGLVQFTKRLLGVTYRFQVVGDTQNLAEREIPASAGTTYPLGSFVVHLG